MGEHVLDVFFFLIMLIFPAFQRLPLCYYLFSDRWKQTAYVINTSFIIALLIKC